MSYKKLDSLSKIMLATGAINYMAVSMDSVNEQVKMIPDPEGVHKEGIKERDETLAAAVGQLSDVMELLGNLLNNQDAICKIDIRATKQAFDIIIHGKDNCYK